MLQRCYDVYPARLARCWDPETGLENLRHLLHTLELDYPSECVHCSAAARSDLDQEEKLFVERCGGEKLEAEAIKVARMNSLGLLIKHECLAELKTAAYQRDASGKLTRAPEKTADRRVILGEHVDYIYEKFLRPLTTTTIPVERTINKLKYSVFARGVGNQGQHLTDAKVGAGEKLAEYTDEDWKRATEATDVYKAARIDTAPRLEAVARLGIEAEENKAKRVNKPARKAAAAAARQLERERKAMEKLENDRKKAEQKAENDRKKAEEKEEIDRKKAEEKAAKKRKKEEERAAKKRQQRRDRRGDISQDLEEGEEIPVVVVDRSSKRVKVLPDYKNLHG